MDDKDDDYPIYPIIIQDVVITIPVPHGVGAPNVAECDGDYTMDTRRSALLWQVKQRMRFNTPA